MNSRTLNALTRSLSVRSALLYFWLASGLASCTSDENKVAPPQERGDKISSRGSWSPVFPLETLAEQMAVLPSGKVLMWGTVRRPGRGPLALFDPASGTSRTYEGTEIESVSGLAFDADGTLLTAGGDSPGNGMDGTSRVWTFDYVTESLKTVSPMVAGREFPGATTLGDGTIILTAGADENREINGIPEIWDGSRWTRLPESAKNTESLGYTYQFLVPDGRLFRAGPEILSDWLDLKSATWSDVTEHARNEVRYQGTAVMYDDGRIFMSGGCESWWCDHEDPVNTAEVIDVRAASPAWRDVSPMRHPRHSHHATLLPDGTIVITGGTTTMELWQATEDDAVLETELWDPSTETFTPVAALAEGRAFQSSAVLLPDATVFVAGGVVGIAYDDANAIFKWSGQVFYPPYLDRGPRPTITNAPSSVAYGAGFAIETPDGPAIAGISIVRLSASSQTWNASQRMARLQFAANADGLLVSAPSDPNLAPPGFYWLFIINDVGVPSIATPIRIDRAAGD